MSANISANNELFSQQLRGKGSSSKYMMMMIKARREEREKIKANFPSLLYCILSARRKVSLLTNDQVGLDLCVATAFHAADKLFLPMLLVAFGTMQAYRPACAPDYTQFPNVFPYFLLLALCLSLWTCRSFFSYSIIATRISGTWAKQCL